jgi:hypothetical protein
MAPSMTCSKVSKQDAHRCHQLIWLFGHAQLGNQYVYLPSSNAACSLYDAL